MEQFQVQFQHVGLILTRLAKRAVWFGSWGGWGGGEPFIYEARESSLVPERFLTVQLLQKL